MSECIACGFDDSLKVVGQWKFILEMSAYSGNQIGGNEKGRKGWKYRNAKAAYRKLVEPAISDIPEATRKRRIWVTRMYGKRKRPYDDDNLYWGLKPLIDIMTKAGVFVDDDPKGIERIYSQLPSTTGKDYIDVQIDELE